MPKENIFCGNQRPARRARSLLHASGVGPCRVIKMPLPDPGEDDGHLISHLVLGQVAEEIEHQYSREQAVVFLEESGIDLDRIPASADVQPQGVADVLSALERWGGPDSRRVRRGFLSRCLTGQLRLGLPALRPPTPCVDRLGLGLFPGPPPAPPQHDGHLF
jgi:hypothetical protein